MEKYIFEIGCDSQRSVKLSYDFWMKQIKEIKLEFSINFEKML